MDGLSVAANVMSIVDISLKVVKLCKQYYDGVKKAKEDIVRLQREVEHVTSTTGDLKKLLESPDASNFTATLKLVNSVDGCLNQLKDIDNRLEMGISRKEMSRWGLRSLKWPLISGQIEEAINNLVEYNRTFSLALQVDHRYYVFLTGCGPKS